MNSNDLIFPPDQNWLEGNFKSLQHLTATFKHISEFIKKHFPQTGDSKMRGSRAYFFIERIDVVFVDNQKHAQTTAHVGFSEDTLTIKVPNKPEYNDQTREQIRLQVQAQFTPVIKESHARTIVLIWKMLDANTREKIEKSSLENLGEKNS